MRRLFLLMVTIIATAPAVAVGNGGVREVQYDDRSVIPIQARLRYTTVLVLPEEEEILDYLCGDKDFWIVNGTNNLAYVKPAKAGSSTNLNLVTTSGRIYSFLLHETNDKQPADLKVFINVPDAPKGRRRYYAAEEYDELRRKLSDAEAAVNTAKQQALESIESYRSDYPARLRFDYDFASRKKPFEVAAIWHDGRSTYIRSGARELPALYEEKDGTPNLINYQVHHGTYVVNKVLERGYLMLGPQKFAFRLTSN